MMAVTEDDVKEQEIMEDDFKKAKEIMDRVRKEIGIARLNEEVIFALCLIYSRQLKHHSKNAKENMNPLLKEAK